MIGKNYRKCLYMAFGLQKFTGKTLKCYRKNKLFFTIQNNNVQMVPKIENVKIQFGFFYPDE